MIRIVWGIFLIAHGLVHAILAIAPDPNDHQPKTGAFFTTTKRSWLLPQLGFGESAVRWIGLILVTLSTLGFILAGLGVLGVPGLQSIWLILAVISSCISLLLLILFWHLWLLVGILIDIAVVLTLTWLQWPPNDLIGS